MPLDPHDLPDAWRERSSLVCAAASVFAFLMTAVLVIGTVARRSLEYEGKPIWIGVLIIATVGFYLAYVAKRISQNRQLLPSAITNLPPWIIYLATTLAPALIWFLGYRTLSLSLFAVSLVQLLLIALKVRRLRG
jgi:predicted neutral ceramidase superfamily lipid hydrolase